MNEVWNLDPIYKGFEDPAFEADLAELKQKVGAFAAFAQGLAEIDPAEGLRSGKIGAVATDSFDQEPPNYDDAVFTFENALTTPHMAAMTLDAQVSGYFFVRIYSRQIVFRTPACTEHCWVRTFDPLPPAAVFDGNTDFDSLSLTENWYIAVRRLET